MHVAWVDWGLRRGCTVGTIVDTILVKGRLAFAVNSLANGSGTATQVASDEHTRAPERHNLSQTTNEHNQSQTFFD